MSTYFHCEDCNNIFAEEAARVLITTDGYGTAEVYACPECRSTAVAECNTCRICGEPIEPSEDYCPDCKWDLRKIWNRAVEAVMAKNDKDSVENERLFIEYLEDGLGVI